MTEFTEWLLSVEDFIWIVEMSSIFCFFDFSSSVPRIFPWNLLSSVSVSARKNA